MRRRALLRSLPFAAAVAAAGCLTAPRADPPSAPSAADVRRSDETFSLSASPARVPMGETVTFTLSNLTDERVTVGGDAWSVWRRDGETWTAAVTREDVTLDLLVATPGGAASWTLRPTPDATDDELGEGSPPRPVPLGPGRYWFLKRVAGGDDGTRYAVPFEVVEK